MGYPMTWRRVVNRNRLTGGYEDGRDAISSIAGDMRRLEEDSLDARHLAMYAEVAGITEEQAQKVLRFLFEGSRMGGIPW